LPLSSSLRGLQFVQRLVQLTAQMSFMPHNLVETSPSRQIEEVFDLGIFRNTQRGSLEDF
jgi:hypothetical protein